MSKYPIKKQVFRLSISELLIKFNFTLSVFSLSGELIKQNGRAVKKLKKTAVSLKKS